MSRVRCTAAQNPIIALLLFVAVYFWVFCLVHRLCRHLSAAAAMAVQEFEGCLTHPTSYAAGKFLFQIMLYRLGFTETLQG